MVQRALLLYSHLFLAFSISRSSFSCAQEQTTDASNQECKVTDASNTRNINTCSSFLKNTCTVYLAPTSVEGGGMGMYSIKSFQKGETILAPDAPFIPIIDPDITQDSDTWEESLLAWTDTFSKYWWESGISSQSQYEANVCLDYQVTVGAMPNSHPMLNNIQSTFGKGVDRIPFDDTFAFTNAGSGAFSSYTGRGIEATRFIEEGEELFLGYNDAYMDWISENYNIPKRSHYEKAAETISEYMKQSSPGEFHVPDSWRTIESELVKSLLPKSNRELEQVYTSAGGSMDIQDLSLAVAKEISVDKKSPEWIQENGICLDNLVPRQSTNTMAGKGAFAQRSMKAGDVIVPVPLLQITDRDALKMPPFKGDKWQLLLNYCFGHEESSLLLCPISNAILINHCSDRSELHPCGTDENGEKLKPNARYRWAEWDETTSYWLNMTVDEIVEKRGSRGLSLEIYATRNIEEGEEVFIDYGDLWEQAWNIHIQNYGDPKSVDNWKSARMWNEELGDLPIAPSIDEKYLSLDERGVLFQGCLFYEIYDDGFQAFTDAMEEEGWHWRNESLEKVVDLFGDDAEDLFDFDDQRYYGVNEFWPCLILGKNETPLDYGKENELYYTVRVIKPSHMEDTLEWDEIDQPRILRNYPRSSIRHFYQPYKSDIHRDGAFRHFIGIDSSIFPAKWRNRV
ncbi:hypothetical protein CTEN210_03153 [Chaetoceros tenuissimus]|uniref:SET domain-containing protein n=1 Tax=Chaetoceros tenuissimus TaxID=426638 RepID=A0AAD3CKZ5_9STRA|nr:hypothetical protein CTEN210_03153 [Chaetoceros tenuissimus]